MIVVTGANGFIGSCLIQKLSRIGIGPLLAVDDFTIDHHYLDTAKHCTKANRDEFIANPAKFGPIQFVFHIGARTDTAEFDKELLHKLNTAYSMSLWNYCTTHAIPMIYASSAATYGFGENGFDDRHDLIPGLLPLNAYGQSKQIFDEWVLQQKHTPPFWAGLKFFNVFGPNEYHKNRMASVVMHGTNQISVHGKIKLFKSHVPEYKNGEQLRDFIYVKDVLEVILFLYDQKAPSAIYNLGTGEARTWNDLATAIFNALNKKVNIEYIDIPEDIRDKYQYFTEARMQKLRMAGYVNPFTSLESAVDDYVKNYLLTHSNF